MLLLLHITLILLQIRLILQILLFIIITNQGDTDLTDQYLPTSTL